MKKEKEYDDRTLRREFRTIYMQIKNLEREMCNFEQHMREMLRVIRKEVDELMPIYKHLKIRPLPEGFHCDENSNLMNKSNKIVKPRSQMEFDTWRLEALKKGEK